jgi:Lon protease-like protein
MCRTDAVRFSGVVSPDTSVIGRLLKSLECPRCRRPLRNPSTLPCGHSFCHTCARQVRVPEETAEHARDLHEPPSVHSCTSEKRNKIHYREPRQDVVLEKIVELVYKVLPTMYDEETTPLSHGEQDSATMTTDRQFDKLASDVLSELECQLCYTTLFEPATTPCGHTFCRKCLARALDHSYVCPLCRDNLPSYSYFHNQPANSSIQSLLTSVFPDVYAERTSAAENEERSSSSSLDVPVFVCTLSFPGLPTTLHIFEPRYRLMMRRAMESNRRFGMVLPARPEEELGGEGPPHHEYGTMLEIINMRMLPDGRSLIETMGIYRFKILESGTLDGYTVARIERLEDDDDDDDDTGQQEQRGTDSSSNEATTEELKQRCVDFVSSRLMSDTSFFSWMRRLSSVYGDMPADDPGTLSYWTACILPGVDPHEKAKLLEVRSLPLFKSASLL